MTDTVSGKKLLSIIGVVLIGIFLVFAARNYFNNNDEILNDNIIKNVIADDDNAQVVELSYQNYNYYPNVINLKEGVPAKIVVDTNKVKGCFSSILIPDLGIRKLVRPGDNVISFTPTKKGEFSFSCAMGMGFGKIIVN